MRARGKKFETIAAPATRDPLRRMLYAPNTLYSAHRARTEGTFFLRLIVYFRMVRINIYAEIGDAMLLCVMIRRGCLKVLIKTQNIDRARLIVYLT